jgi:hypothetical protein
MRSDGLNQLKISAPHPMTEAYRLIPHLAALISLDSPFKLNQEKSAIVDIEHIAAPVLLHLEQHPLLLGSGQRILKSI